MNNTSKSSFTSLTGQAQFFAKVLEFMPQPLAVQQQMEISNEAYMIQRKKSLQLTAKNERITITLHMKDCSKAEKEMIALDAQRAAKKEKTQMLWKWQQLLMSM